MLKIREDVDLKELDNITLSDFINYVKKVRNDEIKNFAPLGFSGEDYIVFENKNKPLKKEFISDEEYEKSKDRKYFGQDYYDRPVSRSCQLSFRKYGDECELLITDYKGNFLTYSKLNFCFDDEFIGTNFYNLFLQLKPYMNKVVEKIDEPINFNKVNFSIGFDMINAYIKSKANLIEKVEE